MLYCWLQVNSILFVSNFILPKFIFESLQSPDLRSNFLMENQLLIPWSFLTQSSEQCVLFINFSIHFIRVFKNALLSYLLQFFLWHQYHISICFGSFRVSPKIAMLGLYLLMFSFIHLDHLDVLWARFKSFSFNWPFKCKLQSNFQVLLFHRHQT